MQAKVSRRTICLLLTLLTLATFSGVSRCKFLEMDDDAYVWMNPYVQGGITWEGIVWAFTADLTVRAPNVDYWQPLTMLSHMLDSQLFGMEASMHHLSNLFIHL